MKFEELVNNMAQLDYGVFLVNNMAQLDYGLLYVQVNNMPCAFNVNEVFP